MVGSVGILRTVSHGTCCRIVKILGSTRCGNRSYVTLFAGNICAFAGGIHATFAIVAIVSTVGQCGLSGTGYGYPFGCGIGLEVGADSANTDERPVGSAFKHDVAYVSRPAGGTANFRNAAVHTVLVKDFEVVDIGFVVVDKTPGSACGSHGVNVPINLGTHRGLGFFLHFYHHVAHVGGRNGAVVVDFELADEQAVIIVVALHAETDAVDHVVGGKTCDLDGLFFPSSTADIAVGYFNPLAAALLAQDNVERRGVLAFLAVLHSHLGVGSGAAHLERGLIHHDVRTAGNGSTREAQAGAARVSVGVGIVGLDIGADGRGAGINHHPTIGGHEILCAHVVPAAVGALAFIEIAFAVAEGEVRAERQAALNGGTFGNERSQAAEGLQRQFVGRAFPVVAVIADGRSVERVAVTAREAALEQALVVLLSVERAVTHIVAHKAALAVFAPEANANALVLVIGYKVGPAAIHAYKPNAGVKAFASAHGFFCRLNGRTHSGFGSEVAAGIVQHQVKSSASFCSAEQCFLITNSQRRV